MGSVVCRGEVSWGVGIEYYGERIFFSSFFRVRLFCIYGLFVLNFFFYSILVFGEFFFRGFFMSFCLCMYVYMYVFLRVYFVYMSWMVFWFLIYIDEFSFVGFVNFVFESIVDVYVGVRFLGIEV